MDRAVVVLLIIGLVIIWLLASSIGTLIKANQEGSSSGAHLPIIRVGTLQPPFALPPINITIPQHANITEASEVYVPLVPLPIIIPNMPISIANYIPTSPPRIQGTTLSGGSGSTGLQGGVGGVGAQNHTVVVPLRISPILIILLLVSVVIIMGIGSLMIVRRSIISKAGGYGSSDQRTQPAVRVSRKVADKEVSRALVGGINLLPGEVIRELKGWGGSNLVDLGIPRDLPLIWSFGEPLPMSVKNEYSVSVIGSGKIENSSLIMTKPGCYGIKIESDKQAETLFIRAVDYDEDVVKHIKLNINNYGIDNPLTVREIAKKLTDEGLIVGNYADVRDLIRMFEEVRYGLRKIDRARYEEFLRTLGRVFGNARVIVCEDA